GASCCRAGGDDRHFGFSDRSARRPIWLPARAREVAAGVGEAAALGGVSDSPVGAPPPPPLAPRGGPDSVTGGRGRTCSSRRSMSLHRKNPRRGRRVGGRGRGENIIGREVGGNA